MCHVFQILQDVEDASFQPTSSGLIPLILLRRCCSHNIEKLPTISRNLPTTRKTFPGLKNGSSHVMRKTVKRVLRRPFFGPLGGQKSVARDPTLDYFSHNVTTTVLESWEVFFESCEVRFTAVEGNDFFVGGTAASRFCLFILKVQLRPWRTMPWGVHFQPQGSRLCLSSSDVRMACRIDPSREMIRMNGRK